MWLIVDVIFYVWVYCVWSVWVLWLFEGGFVVGFVEFMLIKWDVCWDGFVLVVMLMGYLWLRDLVGVGVL